ncbi:MAG: DUF459 domain-containing protein, partial [Mesorhizobium sp.]
MVTVARIWLIVRRLPILVLAIAVLAVAGSSGFHTPAFAQEEESRGWSLRDLLFPRRSERIEPPAEIQKARPKPKKKS